MISSTAVLTAELSGRLQSSGATMSGGSSSSIPEGGEPENRRRRMSIESIFKRKEKLSPASKMKQLEREVMWQALTYVLPMYICWLIFVSLLFYKKNVYSQSFALYCVGTFLLMPLQGFLNFLIYFRPRVARQRRKHRREKRRLVPPEHEGRKKTVLGLVAKTCCLSWGVGRSSSQHSALDDPVQSSECNDSSDMPNASNISISPASVIALEVDGVVEPSAYVCEYQNEAALNIARMNIAEELLEELDRADELTKSYSGEDEDL
jgi:hypothetical protein